MSDFDPRSLYPYLCPNCGPCMAIIDNTFCFCANCWADLTRADGSWPLVRASKIGDGVI